MHDLDHVKATVAEHEIDTVECGVADLQAHLRGKRLTVGEFLDVAEHGFAMADAVFSWDHQCGVVTEATYTNFDTGYPDMHLRPMLDTFRPVPWRPGAAAVLCEALAQSGEPLPIDPRHALLGVLGDAASDGYTAMVGTELEFYLLNPDRTPFQSGIQCYSLTQGTAMEPVLREIRNGLGAFGIHIEACNTEYGPAQTEVNVRYSDALSAADNTIYFKAAVREIALAHGLLATFMAKPFPLESGSGMHIHQSLAEDGTNQFAATDAGDGALGNPLLEHYIAGIAAHYPALVFLSGTSVNSYKRITEYSFAPTNESWGGDNRTIGIRVVGHGAARRVEYRGGASDANPYLLVAGCVAAGMDGVRTKAKLAERTDGNAYARGATLPRSLGEGIAAFEADTVLQEALGPVLSTHLLEVARREWGLFMATVTDWERERYLEFA